MPITVLVNIWWRPEPPFWFGRHFKKYVINGWVHTNTLVYDVIYWKVDDSRNILVRVSFLSIFGDFRKNTIPSKIMVLRRNSLLCQ